jgi:hypothetical protein
MALLDRIVDGAIVLKIAGKSYRAHRAKQAKAEQAKAEQAVVEEARLAPKEGRHKEQKK